MFWLLATELSRRGNQVEVITSDSLGPKERSNLLDEELEGGIHVRRFRNRFNAMSATLPALFYRPQSMRRGLEAAMRRADVVHMGESRGVHNIWTAKAAAMAKVPLAWSAFGGLPTARGLRGLYRHAHDVLVTRRVVPLVDAFIAQTPHEREVYRTHGAPENKIHEIPLCVDLKTFRKLPERGMFRRRLGIGDSDRLVVSVARLAPVKGLELLVEAFAQIPTIGGGRPHLALVGWDHGSLRQLQRLAAQLGIARFVHFPGALFGDDRLIAYVDADVFCLTPVVFEETSLAALEAAAAGCPTLLTQECEVPGLAESSGGMIVPRKVDGVASALTELLNDRVRLREMGDLSRRYVSINFSVDSVADRHLSLFRELVA